MRMTKAELINHIQAGRVFLGANEGYTVTIPEGEFKGIQHVTDGQIDRLGGMVGVEGDIRTAVRRRLFIR